MTLLQQMVRQRFEDRERQRQETRDRLREVLTRIMPGKRVLLFGSIVQPGKFAEHSDIDLALETEPSGTTIYHLISILSEEMGRKVDVMLIDECRFKDKVLRE